MTSGKILSLLLSALATTFLLLADISSPCPLISIYCFTSRSPPRFPLEFCCTVACIQQNCWLIQIWRAKVWSAPPSIRKGNETFISSSSLFFLSIRFSAEHGLWKFSQRVWKSAKMSHLHVLSGATRFGKINQSFRELWFYLLWLHLYPLKFLGS